MAEVKQPFGEGKNDYKNFRQARIVLFSRQKRWSKSIFLENKVVVNYDFMNGAKKSGNLTTRYRVTAISHFSSERAK